jgi:hypothetical protein
MTGLAGQVVRGWHGVEMAVRGDEPGSIIQFASHDDPCLQLVRLTAEFASDELVTFTTDQDIDVFALLWRPGGSESLSSRSEGIYRSRRLPELPIGLVDRADVQLE